MARRHKTLIFHIGDHKTGSTSIQSAFAQRQVSFDDATVFYPTKLTHNHLRQYCNAYAANNIAKAHQEAISVFEILARKIRNSDADFCLVSGEELEGLDPQVFQDIVTTYFADTADEIRIIAYVRPHGARLLSSFVERTKLGHPNIINGTLDTFFESAQKNGNFRYQGRFAAWRNLFGHQFTLRPMIREQLYQGSAVDDFIYHAFGTPHFQIKDRAPANESLALEDLMRLKVLQFCLANHPHNLRYRHAVGWEFSRILNTLPPPETRTRLQLHKALAIKVQDTYLEDARALDRSFFDGAPLMETELMGLTDDAPETPQSVDPTDHLSEPDLRSLTLLSEIIAGLLDNNGQDWPKFLYDKRIRDAQNIAQENAGAA